VRSGAVGGGGGLCRAQAGGDDRADGVVQRLGQRPVRDDVAQLLGCPAHAQQVLDDMRLVGEHRAGQQQIGMLSADRQEQLLAGRGR
jgi:hypothetical protein